jgi:hypothetical protein
MGITPTSYEVKPLYDLLLGAVPELAGSCKAMISALLWLRAYAEEQVEFVAKSGESAVNFITEPIQFKAATKSAPKWDSLSDEEKLAKANEVGIQVTKLVEQRKDIDRDN